MAYEPNNDPDRGLAKWLPTIGMFAVLVVLAIQFIREPAPPVHNALVFGCYETTAAPSIMLDERGMHINQEGFPSIGFHLERHKQGIALTAEAPIYAKASSDGYRYSIATRGIGKFLEFYKVIDGKLYGVLEPDELGPFRMLADDGRYLSYDRTDREHCLRT
ncbi:MAG: hypothetical protein KDE25_01090 [Novosphingobium sp.]|nr:hypothetical protein [Novosphingobium sp.]